VQTGDLPKDIRRVGELSAPTVGGPTNPHYCVALIFLHEVLLHDTIAGLDPGVVDFFTD